MTDILPTCVGCGQKISSEYIVAGPDLHYHHDCFNCNLCGLSFGTEHGYIKVSVMWLLATTTAIAAFMLCVQKNVLLNMQALLYSLL